MLLSRIFIICFTSSFLFAIEPIKIVYNTGTPPLKFTDENKQANGMLIDIWKLWAHKSNINIEFVEAPWSQTLEMIKDGRADIHAGIYYTKQRDLFLDYPKKPLYTNKNYFFYDKALEPISGVESIKPYVIGVGNGYPNTFIKETFPELKTYTYKSATQASEKFVQGEVKVLLSAVPTLIYYLKKNRIDERNYRFNENTYAYSKDYFGAVKEGNKALLKRINDGFELITNEELKGIEKKWTSELDNNYLRYKPNHSVLTNLQQKYLLNKGEITMCVDPEWLPFEAIDNDVHIGMVADIFKMFEKRLGVPIRLIKTSSWEETLSHAKSRECDILSAAAQTPSREKYLDFTTPYLKFPEVIVTRDQEVFINDFEDVVRKKIGIVKNSAISELLAIKYPNINLVETKNIVEGLYKVASGELYGFVNTTAATSYIIAKNGMTNLKIASKTGIEYFLRVATRNDEPQLGIIFNQLIGNINKEEVSKIKDKWLTVKMEEVVDYTIVYQILFWFAVIVAIIMFWNRKLKKEVEERKLAQEEAKKFMQIIEQSKVSIILTDINGVMQYVNPCCLEETGYSQEECLGKKPNIFKSGNQDLLFYQELWETILCGKTWNGEFSNRKKSGEIFWESATIAPIFDDNKKIKFFVSIKENITEKIKVQKELVIAQNEAQKANQAKSDFLAKMSHEIRTPMNAILGMLYLLEKTNLEHTQENYITKAKGAANSLLGVINDILDFSKIEANKLEIKDAKFDLHMLVNEILSIMSVKAEEKNLELLTYYDRDFPMYVTSDSLRLSQILNNLLSNAIKFTQEGEVLVSMKLKSKTKNDAILQFSIQDSGIGISQENQKRLFQEFSQVDDSATRSFHGTGLGLAISKSLCELLGGDIWIESSQEGIGTTICFTMQVKLPKKHHSINFNLPTSMSNLKVLVVDDNEMAAKVLQEILLSFEYDVDVVNSGTEAIQMVQKTAYDLVLLDYKMPYLNGIETYKSYKKNLENKTPKTLLITAYSQELVDRDIEQFGIVGILTKPISPSSLYDSIVESLHGTLSVSKKTNKMNSNNAVLNGTKVLLVEDNEINQEFAVTMLENYDMKVFVANNGLEAIEMISNEMFDFVLMDIQMPKLDGLEATRRIRNMEGEYYKKIPIIALSANALVGDKQKSLDAGMNEHITKPINPHQLFETLRSYLSSEKLAVAESSTQSLNNTLENIDVTILNTKEAMYRMNNNSAGYIKILQQFVNRYCNVFDILDKALHSEDIETLKNKIHELKGVTGNISANLLYEDFCLINEQLLQNNIPAAELFEQSKLNLQLVCSEISKLEIISNTEKKAFDKKEVLVLLDDLKNNLTLDIVKCSDNLELLRCYFEDSYKEFYYSLEEALSEFDTDKANALIESFIKELNEE